jgi:hypothetical protein
MISKINAGCVFQRMRVGAYKLYMCCDELVDHFEITQSK